MYKKIKDLSASQLCELQDCIEALYEMLPLDVENCDEVWLHNRLRHILECLLTDEGYERLFNALCVAKLLRGTLDYIDSLGFIESDNGDCASLYKAIENELSFSRVNNKKMKGGKDA